MAKKIDITDKLSFDENPRIIIRGAEFEVNSDAKTMLEIIGLFSDKSDTEAALKSYEKMFSERDRKKIDQMKLPFKDLMVIIQESMKLIQGDDESGE